MISDDDICVDAIWTNIILRGFSMDALATRIHLNRIFLALAITFLIADTYPHPNLSPGLIETMVNQVQQLPQRHGFTHP